jgi:hypothetical protein
MAPSPCPVLLYSSCPWLLLPGKKEEKKAPLGRTKWYRVEIQFICFTFLATDIEMDILKKSSGIFFQSFFFLIKVAENHKFFWGLKSFKTFHQLLMA